MGYIDDPTKAKPAGAIRWGLQRRSVLGDQLGGGDREAARREEAVYGGRRRQEQDPQVRRVYIPTLVDYGKFQAFFKKYGGTVADENSYPRTARRR